MAGRRPKPTALKALHGNPGKRRLPKNEPKPPAASAELPTPGYLNRYAKQEWRRLAPILRDLGLLTETDLGLLEAWCSAKGDLVQAERQLKRGGIVVEDSKGNLRRSPWVMVKSKAIEQMCRLGTEFGFSPASRPRLGAPARPAGVPHDQPAAIAGSGQPESLNSFLDRRPGAKAVH